LPCHGRDSLGDIRYTPMSAAGCSTHNLQFSPKKSNILKCRCNVRSRGQLSHLAAPPRHSRSYFLKNNF
jgi:hypothetical protein